MDMNVKLLWDFRLDGKSSGSPSSSSSSYVPQRRGMPDFDWQVGTLTFFRNAKFNNNTGADKNSKVFKPFAGSGTALRTKSSNNLSNE